LFKPTVGFAASQRAGWRCRPAQASRRRASENLSGNRAGAAECSAPGLTLTVPEPVPLPAVFVDEQRAGVDRGCRPLKVLLPRAA